MSDEQSPGGNEHYITTRSVQVWKGGFDVDHLDEDDNLREIAEDLEFHREQSLSFNCSCGRAFQEWHTAAEHLRTVSPAIEQKDTE